MIDQTGVGTVSSGARQYGDLRLFCKPEILGSFVFGVFHLISVATAQNRYQGSQCTTWQLGKSTAVINVLVRAAETSVLHKSCKMPKSSYEIQAKGKTEWPGITVVLINIVGPARLISNEMVVTQQKHMNAGLHTFQVFPSPLAGRLVRPETC